MKKKPNIIYILCDDLGYGDLSCCNAQSKINTKAIDSVARDGMLFTNAHSSSAVCTPSRYAILTGRYNWRSRLKEGVFGGFTRHLIEPDRLTVASYLKQNGYHTACIGKWHLGMDWAKISEEYHDVDYAQPIENGPIDVGFDYFFGISASLDMPPYAYIENNRVTEIPDGFSENNDIKAFWRKGAISPSFKHVEVLPEITRKAIEYITEKAQAHTPFFLFFPLPAPHTPIVPEERFIGTSGTNLYGDFVLQIDYTVRQIIDTLRKNGSENDTILIFTSDNGCSPRADYEELAKVNHNPSYVFRGHKADIFEGGHHIPYIVKWPEVLIKGSVNTQTICQTELLRTCSDIIEKELPDNAGEDSCSIMPLFENPTTGKPVFNAIISHSINGSFSIIKDFWKLEMCPDSGGWSYPRPGRDDTSRMPPVQLYDLQKDIGEKNNVCAEYPEKVNSLYALLMQYVNNGRSTPGAHQQNENTDNWEQYSRLLSFRQS